SIRTTPIVRRTTPSGPSRPSASMSGCPGAERVLRGCKDFDVPSGWKPGRVPHDVPGRALLQGPTLPDPREGDRPGDKPLEGVPTQAEAALHAIDEDGGRKGRSGRSA